MTSRRFISLLASLILCATAHAETLRSGATATSMPVDLNLVACHATLAGLTVLGVVFAIRRRPGSSA